MSEDICWISQIRAQQFIPMWSVHFSWWGVHLCHWKLHLQRLLSFSFSLHGNVARSPDYQTADPLSINSYPGTCHKNAHKIQLGPKALNNRTGIISSRLHQSTPGNPYISAPSCNIFKAPHLQLLLSSLPAIILEDQLRNLLQVVQLRWLDLGCLMLLAGCLVASLRLDAKTISHGFHNEFESHGFQKMIELTMQSEFR